MVTMLVAVNTATFISIQGAYDADFFVFLNSNLAGVAGLLFAYVWTRATRPFGAELAVRRLLRSGWEDRALRVDTTARRPAQPRVANARPRHSAAAAPRRVRRSSPPVDRKLPRPAHRAQCARPAPLAPPAVRRRARRDRPRWPASPITTNAARRERASRRRPRARDDRRRTATRRRANMPGAAADDGTAPTAPTAPAAPATPATHRRLRDTLHALVGLRLSLYPAAAGQRRRRRTEHAHDPAFPIRPSDRDHDRRNRHLRRIRAGPLVLMLIAYLINIVVRAVLARRLLPPRLAPFDLRPRHLRVRIRRRRDRVPPSRGYLT